MAAVVEPRINREKLDELLDLGAEHANLDFKETCDLGKKADKVEIAKDIGAMQFDGGFIVIGADSSGTLTGKLTPAQAAMFDEARLRSILAKWIDPPLDLLVGVHDVVGRFAVVIYVGPSSAGACVFAVDGQYEDPPGRPHTAFRQGDVFVRDGSQSRRWQQADIDRFRAKIRASEKEGWRRDFASDLESVVRGGSNAVTLARGPASALTWQLDETTFEQTVVEQLRHDDDIPLRLFLDSAVADADRLYLRGEQDEIATLLDRLTCLLALTVRLGLRDWIDRLIGVLVEVYSLTFDGNGSPRRIAGNIEPSWLQLAVIERMMAVGALAVRRADWHSVRSLVLQTPSNILRDTYTNWIRHAQVMAARAGYLEQVDNQGRKSDVGLLSTVMAAADRLACVRSGLPEGDERLLTSVVQFDFLAMMTVLAWTPSDKDFTYYPSFGRYYSYRIEPTVARLITDRPMRAEIYPGTDEQLAEDLNLALNMAVREGVRFGGGRSFTDPIVTQFLQTYG